MPKTILGYHIQDFDIVCSDGTTCLDNHYLDFLLQDKGDCIRCVYNLDWAIARLCFLCNLTEKEMQQFHKTGRIKFDGYSLFYIQRRYLAIERGSRKAEFSHMGQYDPYLPVEIDAMEAAKKAQEIGQVIYDTLVKIGLHPTSLSSPVSPFQKEILDTLDLPTWEDNPEEVNLYAYHCIHGGRQEAFKKGHFEAWDYDLVSAYNSFAADLIDTRLGKWIPSDKWLPKATYGFLKGTVRIDKEFSFIVCDTKETQITPIGEWTGYVTKQDIELLYKYKIGQFKIIKGWYWFPDGDIVKPLDYDSKVLFEWKQKMQGMEREVPKRLGTGMVGKLQEIFNDNKFGRNFNPVWGCLPENLTKIKIADAVLSNHLENDVLSIAVDGLCSAKEMPIQETGEMGSWRLECHSPAFIVSSGITALQGKQNKGGFSVKYDWLMDAIQKSPDNQEYVMSKKVPVTLGYGLKRHKLDNLGALETIERAVEVSTESRRMYKEKPATGKELLENQYESTPIDVSMLMAQDLGKIDNTEHSNEN